MNFLEINLTMLQKSLKLQDDLKLGKVSHDNYLAQMGGMALSGKIMDRHIKFLNFERIAKQSLSNVHPELVGYDPETEKVDCPGGKKQIERNQCLDYSGDNKFPECEGCEVGLQTKTLLLGDK